MQHTSKVIPEGSSPYMRLYNQQLNFWGSDDSSSAKSQRSIHKSAADEANVSDDNGDEDGLSENNLVYAAPLNAHLESGASIRLKNSFQQKKEGDPRKTPLVPASQQDFYVATQSSVAGFSFEDCLEPEQMVRDILKFHNIEEQSASLTLVEEINDGLLGLAVEKPFGNSAGAQPQPTLKQQTTLEDELN